MTKKWDIWENIKYIRELIWKAYNEAFSILEDFIEIGKEDMNWTKNGWDDGVAKKRSGEIF